MSVAEVVALPPVVWEPRRWSARDVPACFESAAQWLHWRADAPTSQEDPGLPCAHCTVAYQREMVAAGRCANPRYQIKGETDG